MVLLNIQKAFDAVNQKIMLHKLEAIVLHKSAIVRFEFYIYMNDNNQFNLLKLYRNLNQFFVGQKVNFTRVVPLS